MIFSSKYVLRNERYVDVIHVTVFKNVAFKIASEASYFYTLSGQKFIKNAKIKKFKCDIFSDFQTLCSQ